MKEAHNMPYNSSKELLIMPEYGRHVQEMIDYAKTIEDPEYKAAFIEKVIDLMMQMVPQNRNLDDYREKMWKHVYRIADYDLDVVPPNGHIPTREEAVREVHHPGYPVSEPKFRHYGHNVQELVRKALEMEEGEIRDSFVQVIGSYMKLAYKTWNKEHYVSDDMIIEDLKVLSDGQLVLEDDTRLDNLTRTNNRRKRGPETKKSSGGGGRSDRRRHRRKK